MDREAKQKTDRIAGVCIVCSSVCERVRRVVDPGDRLRSPVRRVVFKGPDHRGDGGEEEHG